MSIQDENRLNDLLKLRANHMPSSASAVGMYDAEISKLENKISREREQKDAEQTEYCNKIEAQGKGQTALLHKQLDEERQANVELRQANIAIKTIAEDSQKDAKSAKIFAWISVGIGAAALIVAIIALLV
jgi:hypothetical protein